MLDTALKRFGCLRGDRTSVENTEVPLAFLRTSSTCKDQLSLQVIHTLRYLYDSTLARGELFITIGEVGNVGCYPARMRKG